MGQDPSSGTPSAAASLAPGFRFHPTDQELVGYYLRRKVCGKPFRFDAISEIDIYKCEPWDLPGKSRLKTRDLEWYFFSGLDKKYGKTTGRTNRATERGYWKTTGKDRLVLHKLRTVGMKKTLVYHSGRAPTGERTNWVMHEYKLVDEELEKTGHVQDALVLCRVFQKSGTGPKNGEQYGAPFVEEEWDDELVTIPGEEYAEKVAVGDEVFLDGDDLQQILDADTPSDDIPLPSSFYYEDSSSHVQEPLDFVNDVQEFFLGVDGSDCASDQLDVPHLFDLPIQNDVYMNPVRHEYICEPSNTVNSGDADYMIDDPFLDATDNPSFDECAFLEANDLSNPVKGRPCGFDMVEDYLTFFDPDENEKLVSEQKCYQGGAEKETTGSQQLSQGRENDVASASKQEHEGLVSDIQHPFLKKTRCLLESIYAPPAFASEYPSKDAQLTSTSQSSNSIHITAGIIQIINMTSSSNGAYRSLSKGAEVNIVISFGDAGLEPKSASAMSWARLNLLFFWVLIICMCFKIGSHVYTCKASS